MKDIDWFVVLSRLLLCCLLLFAAVVAATMIRAAVPNNKQKECPSARGLSYDRDLVRAICK
jgi:hypothetical protein